MAQGLQVFDANGNLVLDLTTSVTVIFGDVTIPPNTSVSVTHDGFLYGKPFIVSTAMGVDIWFEYSVSGDTMTISHKTGMWAASNPPARTISYGVY